MQGGLIDCSAGTALVFDRLWIPYTDIPPLAQLFFFIALHLYIVLAHVYIYERNVCVRGANSYPRYVRCAAYSVLD